MGVPDSMVLGVNLFVWGKSFDKRLGSDSNIGYKVYLLPFPTMSTLNDGNKLLFESN